MAQLRVSTCSSLIQYKLQITKQLLLNYVSLHVTAVEVCSGHSFLASCQSDEVVVMTSALYGRMSIGTCVERNMGALGCRSDVIDVAHNACSGRRRCELRVRNPDMDRRMRAEASCANATELSRYLDADYRCQQGKLSTVHASKSVPLVFTFTTLARAVSPGIASVPLCFE